MSKHYSKLVLIDTSYTSFYRFFATLRWFSSANKDEYKVIKDNEQIEGKLYDWSTNQIFKDKYTKMYLESLKKIIKKNTFEKSLVIFCQDAPRSTLWRNELFKKYKGDRVDLSLKTNFKPMFKYTYKYIIPDLVKQSNIFTIAIDSVEADDIIAGITLHLKKTNPEQEIVIVSGDDDFIQLGRDNVGFINYRNKQLLKIKEEDAKNKLYMKILLGDKSDGIITIFPDKKLLPLARKRQLINNSDKLSEYLHLNKDINEKYILNQKLIDFTFIPHNYINEIVNYYNDINKLYMAHH